MKKSLLTLGLLSLATGAFAQTPLLGPWTQVNLPATGFSPNTAASYGIAQLVTLSPTFTWGLAFDVTDPGMSVPRNQSVRTLNAAGTQFSFDIIAGTTGYQPANITVPKLIGGATTTSTAYCGQFATGSMNGGGGEIIRTTNGGGSWTKISNANMFAVPDGFCNWVYAFSADTLIACGDPNSLPQGGGPGIFEFWYTNNATAARANIVWTRSPALSGLDATEYGLVNAYAAVGNTIWAGTSHKINGNPGAARILKSTDKGHTWTAYNTPLIGDIGNIAFKDRLHGIAYTQDLTGLTGYATTVDGGLTWQDGFANLPDLQSAADTARGKFYFDGVTAISNVGFVSYGEAAPNNTDDTNFGASFSVDGIATVNSAGVRTSAWHDIDKARPPFGNHRTIYFSASFVPYTVANDPVGYRGYLGAITDDGTLPSSVSGQGGFYQVHGPLATKLNTELQHNLSVSPNPSNSGVFQLQLADGIKGGTMLTVFDAIGRSVLNRELSATATNAKTVQVDLSKEKAGVYTLRLTTAAGIATQKLVIE